MNSVINVVMMIVVSDFYIAFFYKNSLTNDPAVTLKFQMNSEVYVCICLQIS